MSGRICNPKLWWLAAALPLAGQQMLLAPASGGLTLMEAVRITLAAHPLLAIQQQQIQINRGIQQQASGIFDPVVQSGASQNRTNSPLSSAIVQELQGTGLAATNQALDSTNFSFSATKLFANGISVGPTAALSRSRDNLTNLIGQNASTVGMQATVPLLRNRGREVVTAPIRAAGLNVDAARLDLSELKLDLVTGTAASYWQYAAAVETLQVARNSETRGRSLLDNELQLIDADQAPRADSENLRANLEDRITSRIAAEQDVIAAQQALAIAMGIGPEAVGDLAFPADGLPTGEDQAPPADDPATIRQYIDLALKNHPDLMAAQKRIESSSALLPAAKNQLLPQVDMQFSAGYSGLREGNLPGSFLISPFQNPHGPNASAGVTYQLPLGNHAALGQLQQTMAAERQAELQAVDARRKVASAVVVALAGVRNAISRLNSARQSVRSFETALDAEREKLRLGVGSVVGMLTVEDRLTSVLGNLVQAKLVYAEALIQLRSATATVFAPGQADQPVSREVFVTVPSR